MTVADPARSGAFLERLEALVRNYLDEEELSGSPHSRAFHAGTLDEDVEGRNIEDVYGALMAVHSL